MKRIRKPRVQIQRNTRTEIDHDSRTSRQRTRAAEERAALLAELDAVEEEFTLLLDANRDFH